MKILHVGPSLERTGGPAGYLLELRSAAERSPSLKHHVVFPPRSKAPPRRARKPFRSALARCRRALLGAPRFHRPPDEAIGRSGGPIATLIEESARVASERCRVSLGRIASLEPDVLFVHEIFAARAALEARGAAEVWMLVHAPMPAALYLAWSWGRPDLAWEELVRLPDVARAIDDELDLWRSVDKLVLPCPEALDELVRVDARFGDVPTPVEYLLTGSSVGVPAAGVTERDGEIVGLFLGNGQPYRGLDVLVEAAKLLPSVRELPGTLVLAGPDRGSLPSHPRLRALGRVADVPALLGSVDFVVNANRFSLFDLSNIEAVAAGKALLLHAVGGNETLRKLGAGVRMFDELTPDALAGELAAMFQTPRDDLARLGRQSRACYEEHLTSDRMWERHEELYDRAAEASRSHEVMGA